MTEPLFLSSTIAIAGFLMVWYIHNTNRRLDKHGEQIDRLFDVVKDLAVAMAKDTIGRDEFERRMEKVEATLHKLAMQLGKKHE